MTVEKRLGLIAAGKASTWVPLLLLLIAVPLLAVLVSTALEFRAIQEAELHGEAERWLTNIEDEQRHVFGEASRISDTLIDAGVVAMPPSRCTVVMARLGAQLPRHLMLTITDADGVIRCSTEPQALGHSIADRSTFQQALTDSGTIHGLSRPSKYSGKPMIALVKRYVDDAGRFAGTINAVIDTAWLEDLLQHKPLPPHASLLVADRGGTMFACAPECGLPLRALPEFFRPLLTLPQRGVADIRDGGDRRLITAYSPLGVGVRDTFTVLTIDRDARMAATDAAMLRSLSISAAVLLGSVLMAAWGCVGTCATGTGPRRTLRRSRVKSSRPPRFNADSFTNWKASITPPRSALPCWIVTSASCASMKLWPR